MTIRSSIFPIVTVAVLAGGFYFLQEQHKQLPELEVTQLEDADYVIEAMPDIHAPSADALDPENYDAVAPAAGDASNKVLEVNIYSSRKEMLMKPIFDAYSKDTGVTVNFITDKAPKLIQRLQQEGEHTPADILLTSDVGNLQQAVQRDVLQAVKWDGGMGQNIPAEFRDPEGRWLGLSKRARVIVYNKEKVTEKELSDYESLADPNWKNRLLLRTSNNEYNQSLLASVIAAKGREAAKSWVEGMVANLAKPPYPKDTAVIQAIAAGEGDIGLVNTYYVARILASDNPEDKKVAEKIGVFFPNQQERGVHVNISGGGVTKYAPHPEHAKKLLEYLASDKVQQYYAEVNHEYPVANEVKISGVVAGWGNFKQDSRPLSEIGVLNAEAIKVMDEAGWR